MNTLRDIREKRGLSQRQLAERAALSFRAVQMIESGQSDPRLSSLEKLARALGESPGQVTRAVWHVLERDPDSVEAVSDRIAAEGESTWKLWLFEFVDAFRRQPRSRLVEAPPTAATPARVRALIASTVETLCDATGAPAPGWCGGIPPLPEPWFVSGIENLKAAALVESPVHFRKRKIFVLGNFLQRA